MSTVSKSVKDKQLPAHSVSIEIYSSIARFACYSTVLVRCVIAVWALLNWCVLCKSRDIRHNYL